MMYMNQVQTAWVKAIEKKLGTEVNVESEKDIQLLAKLAIKTNGNEKLVDANK